jgi:hypothetical protein
MHALLEAPRQKKDDIERKRLMAKARLEAKRRKKEANSIIFGLSKPVVFTTRGREM